ncbi:carbohydrate ABC transporter permease [Amycolatopsis nigrescens]|uniref:carbohydrate ABC transporter permease n=1 Tax=Amycolatopsis nigrescens TaxID=381445 RepID=UPI00037A2344|nr:sugar ABC transporter permease [Amycolatopsis nigrescens]
MVTKAPMVEPPRTAPVPVRNTGRGRGSREAWMLVLPALIPVLVLSTVPLAWGIYLGFTNARAGAGTKIDFVGVDNFVKLWHNELFLDSFLIGLLWAVSVTVLQFLLALGLALLLNQNLRLRGLARTLMLIPWAMPPVIVAIMWRLLLDPTVGPVNTALRETGVIDTGINWLGDFRTALPAVIVVGVWVGMPQTTVTLLAGLQGVPRELHEAAAVDGAGTWRRFAKVTLPQLRPVILAITALNFIWNFNSFDLVYVLTAGGPGGQTMLPMLFAYNEAFRYGQFGYASAMGDAMVVVIVIFLALYLRAGVRKGER